jgi:hypothetical protein
MTGLLYLQYNANISNILKKEHKNGRTMKNTLILTNDSKLQNVTIVPIFYDNLQSSISHDNNTTKHQMGNVNVHVWQKICSRTLDSLKEYPLFPNWPDIRGCPRMPDNLISIMTGMWSAQRVMGLFHPPLSGPYRYEITSQFMSEFWLSGSSDPHQAFMLARINKNNLHGVLYAKGEHIPKSKAVYLQSGNQYYFEILHIMNNIKSEHVQIKWMMPGSDVFTNISNPYISTVLINDTSLDAETRKIVRMSPSLRSGETLKKAKQFKWKDENIIVKSFGRYFETSFTLEKLRHLKLLSRSKVMAAFQQCPYSPSYTRKRVFKRYEGVYCTHFSDVFPADDTDGKIWEGHREVPDRHGNTVIEEPVVIDVAKKFISKLEDKYPG